MCFHARAFLTGKALTLRLQESDADIDRLKQELYKLNAVSHIICLHFYADCLYCVHVFLCVVCATNARGPRGLRRVDFDRADPSILDVVC